jgi:hypothetical protein
MTAARKAALQWFHDRGEVGLTQEGRFGDEPKSNMVGRMKASKDIKRMNKARRFLVNTCPASRHVALMAEILAKGKPYQMFADEPEYCADSLASVVASLWIARDHLIALGYDWNATGWHKANDA